VKDSTKSVFRLLVVFGFALALAGCGPSDDDLDNAYDAGYDAAWREKCRGQPLPQMMPSQFDDSMGDGKLVSMYRAGYADAKDESSLCS